MNPTPSEFRAEVLHGLRQPQKELPCKYFYDETGSRLFDAICELEEYYPTRTELAIMRRHAPDMARLLGPGCLLIEYGSGSSLKTRLLLDHLADPAGYVPIDVSCEHLHRSARALHKRYPHVDVLPLCADFTGDFELPEPSKPVARRVVYFPGSTIGNFGPPEDAKLLSRIAALCGPGGALLLGMDLRKDVAVLEPAYNDKKGVTRDFNRNLLARINRELGADFDLSSFRHHAFYNRREHCIEMHLVSTKAQQVHVGGEAFDFREGESIRTERSYKYDLAEMRRRAPASGLRVETAWQDDKQYFAVLYLTVV